jgi:hypothetical protein
MTRYRTSTVNTGFLWSESGKNRPLGWKITANHCHVDLDCVTGQRPLDLPSVTYVPCRSDPRRTHDSTPVQALLEKIPDPVASLSADGAYDTKAVYEAAQERGDDFGGQRVEVQLASKVLIQRHIRDTVPGARLPA